MFLAKTWDIGERFKSTLRAKGNDIPIKRPELGNPNEVYNVNSANLFGTFTALRNHFAQVGFLHPHTVLLARIEF
jgi:hypothetical protein